MNSGAKEENTKQSTMSSFHVFYRSSIRLCKRLDRWVPSRARSFSDVRLAGGLRPMPQTLEREQLAPAKIINGVHVTVFKPSANADGPQSQLVLIKGKLGQYKAMWPCLTL